MNQLRVNDITVGMVCAADILNKNGQLLIPANTSIEEKHLRLLKAWGFTELPIISSSEPAANQSTTATPPSTESLECRFRHNTPSLLAVIEMKKILGSGKFLRGEM